MVEEVDEGRGLGYSVSSYSGIEDLKKTPWSSRKYV